MVVQTALNPREIINRMYYAMRQAYDALLKAKPGDAKADALVNTKLEEMEALQQKLALAFMRKLLQDANIDRESHEALQELHTLLVEMQRGKRMAVRANHILLRRARMLKWQIGGQARKAKHATEKKRKQLEHGIKKKLGTIQKLSTEVKKDKKQLKP